MFLDGFAVRGILANVQNSAVHFGMESLHPAIKHLGKAGQIRDVFHANAGITQ